jgi:hypothetical protein
MNMPEKQMKPVPPVIRSREHLAAQGVTFVPPGGVAPAVLPITADGVTYTMAHETTWIDAQHFAVGRWDGSLSIFSFNNSPTAGPVISKAVKTPCFEGVQMITWLAPEVFASSNDESSMTVWASPSQNWTDLEALAMLKYDPSLGVANSGDSTMLGSRLYLAVGHANGFISLWSGNPDGSNLESQPESSGSLQYARTCYRHLTGYVVVELNKVAIEKWYWARSALADKRYDVTAKGEVWLRSIGIEALPGRGAQGFARECLDWSERRHHMA